MSNDNAQNTPDHRPAVGGPVQRMVRPGAEARNLPTPTDLRSYADDADQHGNHWVPIAPASVRGLADEIERLRAALKKANDQAEHFERGWYLRGDALERIARWNSELPASGRHWPDGRPMSYSAAFGSNGERDFMRQIAQDALGPNAQLTGARLRASGSATC